MTKSTFSTKHLRTFKELKNEIKWESLLLETPDKTNITPKDFILLAIGTPNKEKESLTMEIIDDKYKTEQDLIYVLVIEGKILTGHTGSAYGLYSAMFFEPNEKFGIVVISNGCNPTYENGFNAVIRNTVNCLYKNLIAQ